MAVFKVYAVVFYGLNSPIFYCMYLTINYHPIFLLAYCWLSWIHSHLSVGMLGGQGCQAEEGHKANHISDGGEDNAAGECGVDFKFM